MLSRDMLTVSRLVVSGIFPECGGVASICSYLPSLLFSQLIMLTQLVASKCEMKTKPLFLAAAGPLMVMQGVHKLHSEAPHCPPPLRTTQSWCTYISLSKCRHLVHVALVPCFGLLLMLSRDMSAVSMFVVSSKFSRVWWGGQHLLFSSISLVFSLV